VLCRLIGLCFVLAIGREIFNDIGDYSDIGPPLIMVVQNAVAHVNVEPLQMGGDDFVATDEPIVVEVVNRDKITLDILEGFAGFLTSVLKAVQPGDFEKMLAVVVMVTRRREESIRVHACAATAVGISLAGEFGAGTEGLFFHFGDGGILPVPVADKIGELELDAGSSLGRGGHPKCRKSWSIEGCEKRCESFGTFAGI
jgi:hypothetical protein